MTIACENCPLRAKDAFVPMRADEISFMQRLKVGELTIDAGAPILMEGSNSPQLFTALSGMGLRYKYLPNGRRQVVNLIFPGDFIGLQAGVMGEMGHSVSATTQMTLCVFDRAALWTLFKEQPDRAYAITWLAAVEEHFLGDTLATVGQRDAMQSLAWALVKVFQRGEDLGMTSGNTMPFPFRQQDMADALGLSLVHTNKTLAALRKRQLAHWQDGTLLIPDLAALAEVGMVDDLAPKQRPLI